MKFLSWLKPTPTAKTRKPAAFKPRLEALGDRLNPDAGFGFGGGGFLVPWESFRGGLPGSGTDVTASELRVQARPQAFAGAEVKAVVTAVDANGRPDRDYTGTVALTSSDSGATLPESYTFTAADRGRKVLTVQLATTGEQTITATDTATGTITGETTVSVKDAPVAAELYVTVERDAFSGVATRVLVAAVDANNRPVPTYTGTVTLTSSDTGATLPEAYTFTAADRGIKVLSFTPSTTGDVTITATDGAGLTGDATISVEAAPVAAELRVSARPFAEAGGTTRVVVAAVDADGNLVRNYTGTVALTSSDTAATLPASYTFTAADRGVKTFEVTLSADATGEQTITATDAATGTITGTATVQVGTGFGRGDGFFGPFRGIGRGRR